MPPSIVDVVRRKDKTLYVIDDRDALVCKKLGLTHSSFAELNFNTRKFLVNKYAA